MRRRAPLLGLAIVAMILLSSCTTLQSQRNKNAPKPTEAATAKVAKKTKPARSSGAVGKAARSTKTPRVAGPSATAKVSKSILPSAGQPKTGIQRLRLNRQIAEVATLEAAAARKAAAQAAADRAAAREAAELDVAIRYVAAVEAAEEARAAAALAAADPYGYGRFAHVVSDDGLGRLRHCESTSRYNITNPSGKYRGAYQFDTSTWNGVASRHFPHLNGVDPAAAAPEAQDAMARALWSERGRYPWPKCGLRV